MYGALLPHPHMGGHLYPSPATLSCSQLLLHQKLKNELNFERDPSLKTPLHMRQLGFPSARGAAAVVRGAGSALVLRILKLLSLWCIRGNTCTIALNPRKHVICPSLRNRAARLKVAVAQLASGAQLAVGSETFRPPHLEPPSPLIACIHQTLLLWQASHPV